jgi:hypothetical protein
MTLLAGVAQREISPSQPMYLTGYPKFERIATGVHDPLLASALYLSDGVTSLLFVAVDILMLSHETVQRCRADIHNATGIQAGNILISASHTHSGPVTVDLLAFRHDSTVPPADPAYMDFVCKQIRDAAENARRFAVPARAAFTHALAVGVGGNRHTPDGPHDPQAGIFYLEEIATRRPLAVSIVYSMHPTVLHEDSKLVSADFPGYTRQFLAERLPGAQILYHNGPCGNLSPRYHVTAQTFAEAERLGNRLGECIYQAIRSLLPSAFAEELTLAALQGWIDLPWRTFPSVTEARDLLQQARTKYEHLKTSCAPRPQVRTAEVNLFGAEERAFLVEAQQHGEVMALQARYTPTEVQVLRVGETYFVGLPSELFVEYGLEIKRRAPGRAFVISLANGELQGYIITPGAEGYEAAFSLFTPEAGRALVEEALRLITHISGL